MKNKIISPKILSYLVLFFFVGVFLFVRSFMGLYVFNYRLGELGVLFCFILTGFYVLSIYKKKLLGKYADLIYLLVIFSFFLISFITNSNILDTYTFKSSSYIWTISFIFVGIYVYKNTNFDEIFLKIFKFILPLVYFLLVLAPSTIKEFLTNFFGIYSDKFELHKGSDLLIIFLIVMMINNKKLSEKNFEQYYFVSLSGLFLPLLMFKSRAAFISAVLFFIIEVSKNRKNLFSNNKKILSFFLIFILLFSLSVSFISESKTLDKDDSIVGLASIIEFRYQSYNEQDEGLPIFFIRDERLYSADGNLNWRLQIWQDVWHDLRNSGNNILIGYGYKDKIPAMDIEERQGIDLMNENVHNNFVNILARGGLIQLFLFFSFYYFIVSAYKNKHGNYNILFYILPVLFCAFFDAAMENAHFPLLYYFFLGRLYIKEY